MKKAPSVLDLEASHIKVEAMPGAVMIGLRRDIAGQPASRMMIELSVSEALQHWQLLGQTLRKAGALGVQRAGVDAAVNL